MNILHEFSSEGLYTRYAVDETPVDKNFNMHIHEYCELLYFAAGNAEYLVEGSKYPLKPGDIMIMRPAESHRVKILEEKRYERYVINFAPSVIENIDPQHSLLKAFFDRPLGKGNLYASSDFSGEPIQKIFYEMCRQNGNDYEIRLSVKIRIFRLLDRINKIYSKRISTDYSMPQSLSEKIVIYVNVHLFEKLSIPMLAEKFFLSPSQFSRIFKQATGASPWEYIIAKRLTAAREKICSGASAQAAAESCGFSDYSVFYRSYVKYFGYSPKRERINCPIN